METRTYKRNDWRKTVTIPKNIQEKRDELAENSVNRNFYELHESDARVRHYKNGFDAACSLLLHEIEKLIYALQFECENRCAPQNPCNAQEAIQSWQRFTEGGE